MIRKTGPDAPLPGGGAFFMGGPQILPFMFRSFPGYLILRSCARVYMRIRVFLRVVVLFFIPFLYIIPIFSGSQDQCTRKPYSIRLFADPESDPKVILTDFRIICGHSGVIPKHRF